jgi:hypothetical protein
VSVAPAQGGCAAPDPETLDACLACVLRRAPTLMMMIADP